MSREAHVQFYERAGVKLPRATHLLIFAKPGQGAGLQMRLKRWLEARELKLNEEKTRLVDTRKEAFGFLGLIVAWRQGLRSKRWNPHVEPSAKSQAKLRDKVRAVLEVRTRNQAAVAVVRKVNQITRGWAKAFHYGTARACSANIRLLCATGCGGSCGGHTAAPTGSSASSPATDWKDNTSCGLGRSKRSGCDELC